MHVLTLSHFLAEVVYTPEFWNKNFSQQSYNLTLWRFQAKRNPFYQNQSKKHYTNHIRQLCIGKDWLILVKYQLNFTKVENWVNQY